MPDRYKIICNYCHIPCWSTELVCPGCGAPLPIHTTPIRSDSPGNLPPSEPESIIQKIQKLCTQYEKFDYWRPIDIIPQRKINRIRREFRIPENETIYLVYDNTILGSNKDGFAICESGLYWENAWFTETHRNYINWTDFAKRNIQVTENAEINLDRGDVISVLIEEDRERVIRLLQDIQKIITGNPIFNA